MSKKIEIRDVPQFVRKDIRLFAACQRDKRLLRCAIAAAGDPQRIAAYTRAVYAEISEKNPRKPVDREPLSDAAVRAVNEYARRAFA